MVGPHSVSTPKLVSWRVVHPRNFATGELLHTRKHEDPISHERLCEIRGCQPVAEVGPLSCRVPISKGDMGLKCLQ